VWLEIESEAPSVSVGSAIESSAANVRTSDAAICATSLNTGADDGASPLQIARFLTGLPAESLDALGCCVFVCEPPWKYKKHAIPT